MPLTVPSGVSRNVNAVWRIVNTGTGGSFDVQAACDNNFGFTGFTVPFNATEAAIQTLADTFGPDMVTVIGDADDFTLTFIGPLGHQPIAVSTDDSSLTGGATTATEQTAGSTAVGDYLSVQMIRDDPTGRSFNEDWLARNLQDMDEQILLLRGALPIGQDVVDDDFAIVFDVPAPFVTYSVIFNGDLTAPRTVTLPDTSLGNVNDHLMIVIQETTGDCDMTNTITVDAVGSDMILNAAAGPSPAGSYVISWPYASVTFMSPNDGQWMIVASGPVA